MWKHFTILLPLALASCSRCDGPGSAPAPAANPGGARLKLVDRCALPAMPAPGTFDVALDVAYQEVDGQRLALDIAWPKSGGPHPLVVLIHGGGWRIGDRRQLEDEMKMLVARGYAASTIQYRLARPKTANTFPAAARDVRCAVRFLLANAGKYSIAPGRVALLGLSAGGHLAALTGAAGADRRLDGPCHLCPRCGKQPIEVRGVVSLFPPLDLRAEAAAEFTPLVKAIVAGFLGAPPERDPQKAALASPTAHVKAGLPPFLLVHGTTDKIVPISQSRGFKETLDRAKVPALLVEVPNIGHGFPPFTGTPALRQATCTTLGFLDSVLKK